MLKSYFLKSIVSLCFSDVNKWHRFVYILKKLIKGYQYGYQMKALDLGVKNMLFIDQFGCLFMWDLSQQHRQTIGQWNENKSRCLENLLFTKGKMNHAHDVYSG